MNKHVKRCLIIVLTLVIIATGAFAFDKIVLNKKYDGSTKYSDFWEDPSRYDVWMMGTSHMYYAIHPIDLYEEYGISSYNIAAPSSFLPQTYWTLKCALLRGTPKMVVLDTYHIQQDVKVVREKNKVNMWMDSIPCSFTKYLAIKDLMPDIGHRKTLRYLFPYSDFNKKEVKNYSIPLMPAMGSKYKPFVLDYHKNTIPKETQCSPQVGPGYEYLQKIIDLCNKKDIKLVLTAWPALRHNMQEGQMGMNTAARIAKENNIPFLNAVYDGIYDLRTDLGDDGSHLNPLGAKKSIKYLGDFITENYQFDAIPEENEPYWAEARSNYYQYLKERMAENDELQSLLLWMQDDTMQISYYKNEDLEEDELSDQLIAAMGNAQRTSLKKACKEANVSVDDADYVFAIKIDGKLLDSVIIKDGKRIR